MQDNLILICTLTLLLSSIVGYIIVKHSGRLAIMCTLTLLGILLGYVLMDWTLSFLMYLLTS